MFENIGQWFSDLWTNIDNGLKDLSHNITEGIINFGNNLDNIFKKKDEDDKDNADKSAESINSSVDSIKSKFGFVDNIKTNVDDMVSVITDDTNIPKFDINVNSKYYNGKVIVIDFSWYADYRNYGDTVICMFCYLGFLWNIFIRLPDIISGAGASSYSLNMANDIQAYKNTGFGRVSSIIGKR